MQLDDLRAAPNALSPQYSRFRVADRLLLTGHSHQAWPDVARQGQLDAFDDAAAELGGKWTPAFAKADQVRAGFARLLDEPDAEIALGANTHELVVRFLSGMDIRSRPTVVTTDGEFHSLRRQLDRLAEEGLRVVKVAAEPVDTLAARLAEHIDDQTAAVFVSAVLFETSRIVPGLDQLAAATRARGVELLVDAYHALGVLPFSVPALGLHSAWVVGGGYKYLQLGEGNCFLRVPEHARTLRPAFTGWYAEFAELTDDGRPALVGYAPGPLRFAGATYDPTSNYRAARVFDFFTDQGLTPDFLRTVSQHQTGLLARLFDELDAPEQLISRDRTAPRSAFAGFLALRSPQAGRIQQALAERGVGTDSRGENLRFGPAPYLSDAQLTDAIAALAEVLAGKSVTAG
jgi:selenocysteine lyase/cysteine desulfurase